MTVKTQSSMEKTNWIGIRTLVHREVGRFLNVYLQTIIAPVITTFLFYVIFTLAFDGLSGRGIDGVPYMNFLVPGLIMMAMAQNAFANTSSSLMIGKIQGNIIDILMPPLAAWELLTGYVIGGVMRGVLIGLVSVLILAPFIGLSVQAPLTLLVFGVLGCGMLALMGVLGGIWSQKFDHIAAFTNFFVTPLTFLSGTFYSADRLPSIWYDLAHINPFFYMIDGFRAGFIGVSDMPLTYGIAFLSLLNIALWLFAHHLLKIGYKIKS